MARKDYFKIIYVILTEIFACKEQGCKVNPEDIGYERFGISEGYLLSILSDLLAEGYITGIQIRKTKGTGGYCLTSLSDIEITMKGIEYLQDNSKMAKARDFFKDIKDIVPGYKTGTSRNREVLLYGGGDMMQDNTEIISAKVHVDDSEVRKTLKKLKKIRKLLKEINSLADELASDDLQVKINL